MVGRVQGVGVLDDKQEIIFSITQGAIKQDDLVRMIKTELAKDSFANQLRISPELSLIAVTAPRGRSEHTSHYLDFKAYVAPVLEQCSEVVKAACQSDCPTRAKLIKHIAAAYMGLVRVVVLGMEGASTALEIRNHIKTGSKKPFWSAAAASSLLLQKTELIEDLLPTVTGKKKEEEDEGEDDLFQLETQFSKEFLPPKELSTQLRRLSVSMQSPPRKQDEIAVDHDFTSSSSSEEEEEEIDQQSTEEEKGVINQESSSSSEEEEAVVVPLINETAPIPSTNSEEEEVAAPIIQSSSDEGEAPEGPPPEDSPPPIVVEFAPETPPGTPPTSDNSEDDDSYFSKDEHSDSEGSLFYEDDNKDESSSDDSSLEFHRLRAEQQQQQQQQDDIGSAMYSGVEASDLEIDKDDSFSSSQDNDDGDIFSSDDFGDGESVELVEDHNFIELMNGLLSPVEQQQERNLAPVSPISQMEVDDDADDEQLAAVDSMQVVEDAITLHPRGTRTSVTFDAAIYLPKTPSSMDVDDVDEDDENLTLHRHGFSMQSPTDSENDDDDRDDEASYLSSDEDEEGFKRGFSGRSFLPTPPKLFPASEVHLLVEEECHMQLSKQCTFLSPPVFHVRLVVERENNFDLYSEMDFSLQAAAGQEILVVNQAKQTNFDSPQVRFVVPPNMPTFEFIQVEVENAEMQVMVKMACAVKFVKQENEEEDRWSTHMVCRLAGNPKCCDAITAFTKLCLEVELGRYFVGIDSIRMPPNEGGVFDFETGVATWTVDELKLGVTQVFQTRFTCLRNDVVGEANAMVHLPSVVMFNTQENSFSNLKINVDNPEKVRVLTTQTNTRFVIRCEV